MLPANVLLEIGRQNGRVLATGSRVICNPPPTDTDEDWVVQIGHPHRRIIFKQFLLADGWEECVGEGYTVNGEWAELDLDSEIPHTPAEEETGTEMGFFAFRKGEYNIILIKNHYSFRLWATATALAKGFNLTEKEQRVHLFRTILYGEEVYTPPGVQLNVSYERESHEDMRAAGRLFPLSVQMWQFSESNGTAVTGGAE